MKNKIGKILVLGIIFIFLSVTFAPSLNAISISNNNQLINKMKNLDEGFDAYYFCIMRITTVGTGGQLTWGKDIVGYYFLADNASINIKALLANVGYIWRTNYQITIDSGENFGLMFGLMGHKGSHYLDGFASCILLAR